MGERAALENPFIPSSEKGDSHAHASPVLSLTSSFEFRWIILSCSLHPSFPSLVKRIQAGEAFETLADLACLSHFPDRLPTCPDPPCSLLPKAVPSTFLKYPLLINYFLAISDFKPFESPRKSPDPRNCHHVVFIINAHLRL